MVKIADSAAIRADIPTRPRLGSRHSSSVRDSVKDVVVMALAPSFVLRVRVVRMLNIPERAPTLDRWNVAVFIRRGRRIRGPFQSPRIPGVASGGFATVVRPEQVTQKHHKPGGLEENPDGYNEVPCVPTTARLIGIDSSRHSQQSWDVHEVEGQVEADQEKPEMQFAEPLAIHFS